MSNINNKQAVGDSEINGTAKEAGFQAATPIVVAGRPEPKGMGTTQNQKGRKIGETASLSPSGSLNSVFNGNSFCSHELDNRHMNIPSSQTTLILRSNPRSANGSLGYSSTVHLLDFLVSDLSGMAVTPEDIEWEMGVDPETKRFVSIPNAKVFSTKVSLFAETAGIVSYSVVMVVMTEPIDFQDELPSPEKNHSVIVSLRLAVDKVQWDRIQKQTCVDPFVPDRDLAIN